MKKENYIPSKIEIEIKKRLSNNIKLEYFKIKDFTGRHLNHKLHEGGFHLETIIVSNNFCKLNLLQRHKKVYEAVGNLMNNKIHALSMKTYTKEEWDEL